MPTEKKLNKTLVIENINHDNNYSIIQNFIQNIKQDLLREYTSTNRHIIPPLNPDFIAGIEKHDPIYPIELPAQLLGGGKRTTHKKSHKHKRTLRKRHHINKKTRAR